MCIEKGDVQLRLVIVGARGYAKVVVDIAIRCGYEDIIFLEDDESMKACMGYPVVGNLCLAKEYSDSDFFIAVGNPITRERIYNKLLADGMHFVTLIHPNAVIAEAVSIGIGSVVMAGAVINSDSRIGNGCIVDTGSTVDHDDLIEDFVHVAVGSHLAGMVHIGRRTWIGAGAIVSNNVNICGDCMIGAGAVVIKDIDVAGTYAGVPVRRINGVYFRIQ